MILAQQFPPLLGNRSLFADLYALSLHGLSEHGSKGNMYRQLTSDFSVLIEAKMSAFSIFFSNSYHKKWKYYTTNRLSLTFTVFIKVRNLISGQVDYTETT